MKGSASKIRSGRHLWSAKDRQRIHVLETYYSPRQQQLQIPILLGTPTLGTVRIEWAEAINALIKPCNWVMALQTVVGYETHTAQNILVTRMIKENFRALLLVEDDNKVPGDLLLKMSAWLDRMNRKKAPPVVSGLYYLKGSYERDLGPEPLVYTKAGHGACRDFRLGDLVKVDGFPTGCVLIHGDLLRAYAAEPDITQATVPGVPYPIYEIFEKPQMSWTDALGNHRMYGATSDLWFAHEIKRRGLLTKAGWPMYEDQDHWAIIDTSIRVDHLDRFTGRGQDWPLIERLAERRYAETQKAAKASTARRRRR